MYHAHGWVQQIKMLKHWKRTPSLAAKVTNEVLKRGQDALETYEKMFPETIDVTRHWSGTGSLEGALTALGDETTYAVSFRFTSAISHATDFGAHFESDGDSDEVIWQIEPRVRGFEAPSYAARELLWKAAHRIDERLGLGFDEKLAPFQFDSGRGYGGQKVIAAIYARKSTEQHGADADAKSVARQIESARAFAAARGWIVADAHVYADDAVSGADLKRLVQRQQASRHHPLGSSFSSAHLARCLSPQPTRWRRGIRRAEGDRAARRRGVVLPGRPALRGSARWPTTWSGSCARR